MDAAIAEHLEALSREDLLELVKRLYGRQESIDREIELFVARPQPRAHEQELRRWIRSWTARRDFVSYRQSFDLAREVEDVADELEILIQSGDPAANLALAEDFLAAGGTLMEMGDDSSGAVSGAFREAVVLWLAAAKRCREQGIEGDWIGRLQDLEASDDYGLLDLLLPQASILLGETELRELARRYEAQATAPDPEDTRAFGAGVRLGQLAWALRDPQVYVRSVTLRSPEPNELQKESIARCFLTLGDPEGALSWLEGSWSRFEHNRLVLRAQVFDALGRKEELAETRRLIWEDSPSPETLEDLLKLLPEAEQEATREQAIRRASSLRALTPALRLLLHLQEPTSAHDLLLARSEELEGDHYSSLKELAEAFETAEYFLASTLIHRALLESILNRAYSRAYHHAARYFRHLTELAGGIEKWHGVLEHEAYVNALQSRHGRKRSFWAKV